MNRSKIRHAALKPASGFWNAFWTFPRTLRRTVLNPIFVFIVLQLVGIFTALLWIVWFLNLNAPDLKLSVSITYLALGCAFGVLVSIGTVLLFVFTMKQLNLIRRQRSFVSSVTHEFRSPLASLQLSLETLEHRKLDPAVTAQQYELMRSDLHRVIHLVDQILVSARLDRGIKDFPDQQETTWRQLITKAMDALKHMDLSLVNRVEISGPIDAEVTGSVRALQLVLGNILENAIKYSDIHSKIKINLEETEKKFKISVQDSGRGMEQRELKRVFKIFERSSSVVKEAIPGTGIGLHIVRNIVDYLGGKVWATSSGPGRGTTFHLVLPKRNA